jgi:hypothetical protein
MKKATPSGMGATCERNAYGSTQKRQRAQPKGDEKSLPLFEEVRP